ncbi:MAG TPA: enoyl-CoA hydratase/isomerase family protein [Myxococcaceae bacterium]|nr:enoyl-CoA hydratase/isomerase family protein [Myxococcaceae bacterium]
MTFVNLEVREGIATVRIERGKVNALNEPLVDELSRCLRELEDDPAVRGVLLTGTGKFFSFGFDIPEFLGAPKEDFARYLRKFATLYRELFAHRRPVVAALNGHAVAGGCMIATACDVRVMVKENAKIGLNEIGFGSSLFAGSLELLRFWVGDRRAQQVAYGGALYTAEQALALGLVDAIADGPALLDEARSRVAELAGRFPRAFARIKRQLRQPVLDEMHRREDASIGEFVEIWYSKETRAQLELIRIRP